MIESYNASAVKNYNVKSSLVPFWRAKLFYTTLKNALVYYNAGVAAEKSEDVGLSPELKH
jgi:hypothetical protein